MVAGDGDKRRRILDAAEEVFASRGYHGARIQDIAKKARVADGTIYNYFKNKDDLLVCLFEDRMDRFISILSEAVSHHESAMERLAVFFDTYLAMAGERPHLAEVMSVELRSSPKFMKEYKNVKFLEFLGIVSRIVAQGQEAGEIRPDLQPDLVARAMFGAIDELVVGMLMSRRKKLDAKATSRQIITIFWSGLQHRREEP